MVFFVVFGEDLQVTTLRQMQFHYWGHIIMQWYLANVQTNVIAKQNDNHCREIIVVKCWQGVSNPSWIGRFLFLGSCFFHVAAASLEGPFIALFAYTKSIRWSITKCPDIRNETSDHTDDIQYMNIVTLAFLGPNPYVFRVRIHKKHERTSMYHSKSLAWGEHFGSTHGVQYLAANGHKTWTWNKIASCLECTVG